MSKEGVGPKASSGALKHLKGYHCTFVESFPVAVLMVMVSTHWPITIIITNILLWGVCKSVNTIRVVLSGINPCMSIYNCFAQGLLHSHGREGEAPL